MHPRDNLYRSLFKHLKKKIGEKNCENKSIYRCGIIFQPFLSGPQNSSMEDKCTSKVSDSNVSSYAHPYFSPLTSFQRRFLKKNGHLQSSVAEISQTGDRDESFQPLSNPGAEESFIPGIHPLLSFIYARGKRFVFGVFFFIYFFLSFFVN